MDNWLNAKNKPNQTQFKANSNPTEKMAINAGITTLYAKIPPSGRQKNKPNTNPIPEMNLSPYRTQIYASKAAAGPAKTNPNKPISDRISVFPVAKPAHHSLYYENTNK
jgi:hypothetical protein